MRKDDEKDLELGALCTSIQRDRLVLARQRQIRVEMVRDYAGPYWGSPWTENDFDTQPLNMMQLYVSVMSRGLIAKNPRVGITTYSRPAKPVAHAMQEWTNKHLPKIDFAETLKRIVHDGFFTSAIAKVGICSPGEAMKSGWKMKAGDPGIWNVDFDDFVYDTHARDFRDVSYIGHRWRCPRAALVKMFGKKAPEASEDRIFNLEGDERINMLGRGLYGDSKEWIDWVDLWEIYLPHRGVIVTLADDYMTGAAENGKTAKALKVQKWIGPDRGPYHVLSLITIPGNAMGKGPLQDLWDMHRAINNIFRKLIRQAQRQKEVLLVQGGADADGNRLVKTNDGEGVRVDNPGACQTAKFGGPNNENYVLAIDLIQRFSKQAGNLDALGGLDEQGKTATSAKLLSQNAATGMADMQATVVQYVREVVESMLWFHHHHPSKTMQVEHGPPEASIVREVTPAMRQQVPWEMLDIEIAPYSLAPKSPQEHIATLNQIVQTTLLPMMGLAQQQGVGFDMRKWLAKIGEGLDEPDLQELLVDVPPPQAPPSGGGEEPGAPGPQTTTHVRENVPQRTQAGDQMNLRNALMGVNPGGNPNSNGKAMGSV